MIIGVRNLTNYLSILFVDLQIISLIIHGVITPVTITQR